MGRKHRHKAHGHYCWECGSRRPNEAFSGKGHARHICKKCQQRPAAELAYLQALRNLEQCGTWEGIIPRKRRKQFLPFLDHADPRIRALAREMQEQDLAARHRERMLMQERSGFLDDDGGDDGFDYPSAVF